jgi:anti-sigma28 factor (negative regulator of flagellin synthesis)
MPHRKRRLGLIDVAMGRVWVRIPRYSENPLLQALLAGNPIDRTRTFIGTLLDPAYCKAAAERLEKEKLARFMDGNLGVAYVMSGSQTGKTEAEDVVRAFTLKHLQPRTLAPGEKLQEGQCVGCPVPPEKHEPGCSLDCLGPKTHGPRIETMAAAPAPGTQMWGEEQHGIRPEPINTSSTAPAPDKAREQTIEEMCMTWKNGLPLHIASNVDNDHIRSLMAQVYDHSVAPRVKRIKDQEERIERLKEYFAELQDEYRELFGAVNQMCVRTNAPRIGNLQEAVASIKAITDHTLRLREEVKIGNEAFNRAKGWPVDAPVAATLFDKPLDYWQELEAKHQQTLEAHEKMMIVVTAQREELAQHQQRLREINQHPPLSADARLLIHVGELRMDAERIADKLKLKPGTPTEIVLGTIQSIQQHAERYRACAVQDLVNGDRIVASSEYERLLAIEHRHQLDADTARCAQAENHSLKEQLKLIGAALKRADIEHPEGVWHIGVCDLATRYLRLVEGKVPEGMVACDRKRLDELLAIERDHQQDGEAINAVEMLRQSMDSIRRAMGLDKDAWVTDILGMIEQRTEHFRNMKERTDSVARILLPQKGEAATTADVIVEIQRLQEAAKPIYGVSPLAVAMPALKTLTGIAEAIGIPAGNLSHVDLVQEVKELRQAFEDSELGRVDATRKVKALRKIVLRKAPHTSDCLMKEITPPAQAVHFHGSGLSIKCGCWKAEFMAEADKP